MATIEEAETYLSQQRSALAERRRQIESAKTKIEQTRMQLSKATPQSQVKVRSIEELRRQEKLTALGLQSEQEQQFASEEKGIREEIEQIKSQQARQQQYQNAYNIYSGKETSNAATRDMLANTPKDILAM